jgi:hypothetical protein
MFNYYAKPVENATLHIVGYNELVKELGITEEEAKFLGNKVYFNFWFAGNDYDTAKKWTVDGDDIYSEFSFKEFLLAMICDYVCGAYRTGKVELAKGIENISNLHKHIHFANTRVTIKERYFGIWKNGWKF